MVGRQNNFEDSLLKAEILHTWKLKSMFFFVYPLKQSHVYNSDPSNVHNSSLVIRYYSMPKLSVFITSLGWQISDVELKRKQHYWICYCAFIIFT